MGPATTEPLMCVDHAVRPFLLVIGLLALLSAGAGCGPAERAVCGDGVIAADETCDDDNTAAADGCSGLCRLEAGWVCAGEPSVCTETADPVCGDGLVAPPEGCDDGATAPGDGCSDICAVEAGFTCTGEPSVCTSVTATCGDGVLDPGEGCDDLNATAGDGCDTKCAPEPGYVCVGEPSVCAPPIGTCANGIVEPGESCDDANTTPGDGCDATCTIEPGTTCGDAVDLDDPANVTVSGATTTYLGDTTGSTVSDFGTIDCATPDPGVEAVVHRYTMTQAAALIVQTQDVGGTLADPIVYGYLDCQSATSNLFCNDDFNDLFSFAVTPTLPAGTTVYVIVTGYSVTDVGPYQLDLTEVIPSCALAAPLAAGATSGETLDTEANTSAGSCVGFDTPEDVYEIVMAGPFDLTVDATPGPTYDVGVYLRSAPCDGSDEIACIDNAGDGGTDTLAVTDLPAGTYYLFIDGYVAGDVGTYDLTLGLVTIIPAGDPCTPSAPAERCETGTSCTGPPGAEACG